MLPTLTVSCRVLDFGSVLFFKYSENMLEIKLLICHCFSIMLETRSFLKK